MRTFLFLIVAICAVMAFANPKVSRNHRNDFEINFGIRF